MIVWLFLCVGWLLVGKLISWLVD